MTQRTEELARWLRQLIEETVDYVNACEDGDKAEAEASQGVIVGTVQLILEREEGGGNLREYANTFVPDLNGAHEMNIVPDGTR